MGYNKKFSSHYQIYIISNCKETIIQGTQGFMNEKSFFKELFLQ